MFLDKKGCLQLRANFKERQQTKFNNKADLVANIATIAIWISVAALFTRAI